MPASPALAAVYANITNKADHKCLDAASQNLNNGDKIQVWDCWGGFNQHWLWQCPAFGSCEIINQESGRCLDAESHNLTTNGDKVQLWDCWGGTNQLWDVGQCDLSGYCQITNAADGKCLDADLNNINTNGATVQLWDCWYTSSTTNTPAPNQMWQADF